MLKRNRLGLSLWILGLLGASALIASPVAGAAQTEPVCGPDEREAFLAAANSGVPAEELLNLFGHCSDATTPAEVTAKVITINNGVGSIFYEQMNGCGYHPQIGVAVCDVEIKQPFGFGPFGPPPLGSTEYVDFCFPCGPLGTFVAVQGTVHVTDERPGGSGAAPSWPMMAYAVVPTGCVLSNGTPVPSGSGQAFPMIATLSWGVPALAPCSAQPGLVWGNQISFDARDDP